MVRARVIDGRTLAVVMLGGAVGVSLRAAIVLPVMAASSPLVVPAVTLAINLAGSLLLGIVVGWLAERRPRLRAFLGTGVMGGFTTYSAFAVQTSSLLGSVPAIALALAAASVVLGVIMAIVGLYLGRRLADVPGEIESPEDAE